MPAGKMGTLLILGALILLAAKLARFCKGLGEQSLSLPETTPAL